LDEHPVFEIVQTKTGVTSIRNKVVNEIMHNPVGPWIEANSLYIDQSDFRQRLMAAGDGKELVVFDVGLGAAANALAAIHAAADSGGHHKFKLISFERDLELLRFALSHADKFAHFKGFEDALIEILKNGKWQSSSVSWELRHGDFLELIDREPNRASIVFYDPYSPRMNVDMWTVECFRKLRAKCSEDCTLFTYSRATPIRAALLCADFFVGVGNATGSKDETTIAAADFELLKQPLAPAWLERWKKSHTPFPLGLPSAQEPAISAQVLGHRQFRPR
jgi:queuine tRNA-ribosyltransferase